MATKKSKTLLKFVLLLNGRKTKIKFINSECFFNGERIYVANSENEWKEASKKHIPTCYSVKSTSSENIKLYNWYAVIDSRDISSDNFQIPTDEDLALIQKEIYQYFGKRLSIFQKVSNILNRRKLFDLTSTGYITSNGDFITDQTAIIWTKTEYDKNNAYCYSFDFIEQKIRHLPYSKDHGFALFEIEKLTK